ncbi:hypothetical protein [Armatimonas rosea]|uniref:Uncharacterized protein n=1 Tax=Armatimonas rosea TaxID=685828 RepID=A0A7W9STG5_ARMRO|nr:hypothetical protein [Armatimonas rosea]MBB6051718.1 hypothetical protein [Armatimonas rosea]
MTIQAVLDILTPLPGVRGASVLDLATGVCMGSGGHEAMEADRLASDYARSLNTIRVHLEPQANEDLVQEMRLQLPEFEVCITPLSHDPESGLYLCLLLQETDDTKASLGIQLELIRSEFQAGEGLLGEDEAEALYNYRVSA